MFLDDDFDPWFHALVLIIYLDFLLVLSEEWSTCNEIFINAITGKKKHHLVYYTEILCLACCI